MKTLIKSMTLVFLIVFPFGCNPVGFTKLANGTYEHTYSGFDFPEEIGKFKRSPTRNYDKQGRNISVSYLLREPDCNITFTIYVYPSNDDDLQSHFEFVKKAITYYHQDARSLSENTIYYIQDTLKVEGIEATYRYSTMVNGNKQLIFTRANLFVYKNQFIKYRITYPEYYQSCVDKNLSVLMDSLKWNI